MRFRLRTLLIAAALLPPILCALWYVGIVLYRSQQYGMPIAPDTPVWKLERTDPAILDSLQND